MSAVIGRWKVVGPRISVHTVGLLAYTDWPHVVLRERATVTKHIDSLSCLVLRWPSMSKIVASDQSMTWLSFCHVIRYGWLVGFCCQIFPICPCQCSVADRFHFFSVLFLSLCITPACFSVYDFLFVIIELFFASSHCWDVTGGNLSTWATFKGGVGHFDRTV